MQSKTLTIAVEKELVSYIESLYFDLSARRDTVTFMLEHDMDTSSAAFEKYHREMVEFNAKYETAKGELEAKFVQPLLKENQRADWSLSYADYMLTVTIYEAN